MSAAPWPNARVTGVVYLCYFLTAIAGVVLISKLVVSGDAAATATNILAHEPRFRLSIAISLISTALYIVVTVFFYGLFKPVNSSIALLAAFFSLVGCAIQACGAVFQISPLVLLGGSPYLHAFNAEQLQALARMFLDLNMQIGYIYIVFFGFFDILIGYLIFRSTFLPRVLGMLMAIAGLGWLIFLWPPLATHFSVYIDIMGFIAELFLMIWLLVMGVNVPRWHEQATAAR